MAELVEQTPNVFGIKERLALWRRFAKSHIEPNPATDGTLDRTAAAKALDAKLQGMECSLAAAERNAPSGNLFVVALDQAVSSFSNIHQLAIIDNEKPIAGRLENIESARRGGRLRSADYRNRNRQMAQHNRQGGTLSDTALMVAIGKARGLKRRASINAVKSGIRDLKNCPARPG